MIPTKFDFYNQSNFAFKNLRHMVKLFIQNNIIPITFVCHKILNAVVDKVHHDILEVFLIVALNFGWLVVLGLTAL